MHRIAAVATGVSSMPRAVEHAAAMNTTSDIYIPPAVYLAPAHLTLEAWIRPDVTGGQTYAIANQPQYARGYDGSTAYCAVGNADVSQDHASGGAWTHVACTYDGDRLELYVNGSIVKCSDGPDRIDTPRLRSGRWAGQRSRVRRGRRRGDLRPRRIDGMFDELS